MGRDNKTPPFFLPFLFLLLKHRCQGLLTDVLALKRAVFVNRMDSLATGVLGYGLGSLADSVLCELPGQQKTDRCLDFSRCYGGLLVVVS